MSAIESLNHSLRRLRQWVYALLETTDKAGFRRANNNRVRVSSALLVECFLVSVIIINSAALVLWTVPELALSYASWFHAIEYSTVSIFLVEYALRFWTAPESADNPETAGWQRRWRYLISPHALVDAAALVPSGVAVLILLFGGGGPSLSFLLTIRLLTRTAKLVSHFPPARRLVRAVRQKAGQLLTTVAALFITLILAATLMYFAETEAQPEVFSSIPASMWWSVVTLTTVGYGDTVPITPIGRVLAAAIAVLGIGLFALPAGIISAGLLEVNTAEDTTDQHVAGHLQTGDVCPHCGQPLPGRSGSP